MMSTYEARTLLKTQLNDLEHAIAGGSLTDLEDIVNQQCQTRLRDDVLADALAISCDQGHHEATHHLLAKEKAKADSRSKNKFIGQTPLILATKHCAMLFQGEAQRATGVNRTVSGPSLRPAGSGQSTDGLRTLKSLLKYGASLTGHAPEGRNVLFYVVSAEVAELLLTKRAKSECRKALNEQRDDRGFDALMWAITNPDCSDDVSLSYIKHGADLHTVDKEERTTLMNAVWRKRVCVVEKLLEDDTIVKMVDKRGRNIWHHVAANYDCSPEDDTIKLLFALNESDSGVRVPDIQGQTPLHISTQFGNISIGKAFLEKKDPIVDTIEMAEQRTALHFAAASGDADFVKALLERGANRFALCFGGLTPLHLVCGCVKDAVDATEHLMEHEAKRQLSSRTEENMTPLHIAAAHGNEAIVNFIIRDHPTMDIDARSEGGWTALHLACGRRMLLSEASTLKNATSARVLDPAPRYLAVVRALLSAGANVNTKSRLSRTALHIAAEMGHVETVELLLQQKNVQFSARDSRGNTPLIDAATSRNRTQILELLAPWNTLLVQSLPREIQRAVQLYDANIIDFHDSAGSNMVRHKIPVSNVLYKACGEPGALNHNHVSTGPDPTKGGAFRWIHLPANNLHWCHLLIMKHFIECSADVERFKALEQSLSQQRSRGRKVYSRSMRPGLTKLVRRYDGHSHVNHPSVHDVADDSSILDLRQRDLLNDTEVAEDESVPPIPRGYTDSTNRDFSGLRIKLEPQVSEDPVTHEMTVLPLRLKLRTPDGGFSATMESGQGTITFPERRPSPPTQKSNTRQEPQEFGACLFMPYLILENKETVKNMQDQLGLGSRRPFVGSSETALIDSQGYATSSQDRDAQLHKAYSQWHSNEYSLEVRRTLDQFWHSNVDTHGRDGDQVVKRYQEKKKEEALSLGQGNIDLLMVDQLWIWVLEPSLIVTSFPQDWQLPRSETPDLLSSILGELNPRNGTAAKDIYELAACIIEHCLKASDEKTEQSDLPSVTEMFEATIAELTQDESILSRRFNAASVSASLWIKNSLLKHNTQGNEDLQEFNDRYTEALRKIERGSGHIQTHLKDNNHDTEEPLFLEHLLDIQPEISFLEGVKRVQYELRILDRIADDQYRVTSSARDTFTAMQRNERTDQEPVYASWKEKLEYLRQHRNEIAYLSGRVQDIYKSVIDLLDHKQRYANAIEARYARAPARTLMVFTVVTVVFLPLSFLTSFFTINIRELPYVDDQGQQLKLAFVLRYVLGIGLGTALLCVAVALYHHGVLRWLNRRRMVIWVKKHRLKLTQAAFTTKERQSKRSGGDDSEFEMKNYESSSTLRSRRGHVRDDMEIGGVNTVR